MPSLIDAVLLPHSSCVLICTFRSTLSNCRVSSLFRFYYIFLFHTLCSNQICNFRSNPFPRSRNHRLYHHCLIRILILWFLLENIRNSKRGNLRRTPMNRCLEWIHACICNMKRATTLLLKYRTRPFSNL